MCCHQIVADRAAKYGSHLTFIAAQYSKHKHGEECPNENSCDECDDISDHRLIENVSFYFVDDVLSSIEAFYGII